MPTIFRGKGDRPEEWVCLLTKKVSHEGGCLFSYLISTSLRYSIVYGIY